LQRPPPVRLGGAIAQPNEKRRVRSLQINRAASKRARLQFECRYDRCPKTLAPQRRQDHERPQHAIASENLTQGSVLSSPKAIEIAPDATVNLDGVIVNFQPAEANRHGVLRFEPPEQKVRPIHIVAGKFGFLKRGFQSVALESCERHRYDAGRH
jgi:hypothetical protein